MRCPQCGCQDDKVVDSRAVQDGRATRRRRQCEGCGRRFTTFEQIEESTPIIVKKDGRRESWERQKLIAGLQRACEKRPVPTAAIESFADRLEQRIVESGTPEVAAREVGEAVMGFLREADAIAYLRFASVYKSFSDLGEFLDEIEGIRSQEPT